MAAGPSDHPAETRLQPRSLSNFHGGAEGLVMFSVIFGNVTSNADHWKVCWFYDLLEMMRGQIVYLDFRFIILKVLEKIFL